MLKSRSHHLSKQTDRNRYYVLPFTDVVRFLADNQLLLRAEIDAFDNMSSGLKMSCEWPFSHFTGHYN